MTTATKITMTISGDTFKAREKLKSEGFSWSPASKSWSCEMLQDGETYADLDGNSKGTLAHVRHMVKTYAKSDRFEIAVG